jgi:sugar phosphate isomerase/epimerase
VTRRQLLQSATGFAAAAVTAFPAKEFLKAGVTTSAWKIPNDDFPALLKVLPEISKFGFEGFETNFRTVQSAFGKQSKDAKAQIADTGLRFLGCHVTESNYDAKTNVPAFEDIQPIADGAASLGAERLIISGAPVAEEGAALDPERLTW